MTRGLLLILCAVVLAVTAPGPVLAVGERILAMTGQYTFFIKPDPTSCVTYHQKMVPCVEEKTIPHVRKRYVPIPYPVAAKDRQGVLRSEIPLGTPKDVSPCIECFPRPECRPGVKDCVVPRIVPVPVPFDDIQPRCVTKRIMLPQWFKVEDHPKPPPRKVRKVRKVH